MPVNEQNLIDDLTAMVRIPSTNRFGEDDPSDPAEAAMADFFEKRLQDLNLEVESVTIADGRRNVWGRLKGTGNGPTIMLAGHLDTVGVAGYDEPFIPHHKDGRIYGRGSCDMKAGLVSYLEVVRLIQESNTPLKGDLIIAGVIDEEHAMIGSKHFGEHGPHIDYAIIAEPSSLAVSPKHRGQINISLQTTGLSAHSSVPENGVNAIYHMGAIINAIQEYAENLKTRTPDPMCGLPTCSIGVIKGGENVTSIPDFCEIEIDRRTIPGESFDSVLKELSEILETLAKETPDLKYKFLEPNLNVPPLDTDMQSPVVTSIIKACEKVTGRLPEIIPFPGSTDGPNFGCPSVICGAGALAQAHSLNEFVEVEEIKSAVEIYIEAIRSMQD